MKQMVCEMCMSHDLLKQDGVFVCQHCGCKYTVEEARKMMIEGSVDVSGSTVKVDTSAELENLYHIARRAKSDNNGANAAKYYDMILVKDPTSWEASFYLVYFKAMECKIAQIRSAAISVGNCQDSVMSLIRDHVSGVEEQRNAVKEVLVRTIHIANMLYNGAKNHYDGIDSNIKNKYTQEFVDNGCAARDVLYTCGSVIDHTFSECPEIAVFAAEAWKAGIELHKKLMPYFASAEANKQTMLKYARRIGKYDPAYEKKYTYEQRKKTLEEEIKALEHTISVTNVDGKWGKFGLFFIGVGIFMMLMGMILSSLGAGEVWPFAVGGAEILLGILLGKPNKNIIENNRKKVVEAKESLAEKKKELEALMK